MDASDPIPPKKSLVPRGPSTYGARVAEAILASGQTRRTKRPDIWMQAIRSHLKKLLCHGALPILELASRKPSWPAVKLAAPKGRTYGCKRSDPTSKSSCATGPFRFWSSRRGSHLGQRSNSPHQKAGHMDASDPIPPQKALVPRGPSTYGSRLKVGTTEPRAALTKNPAPPSPRSAPAPSRPVRG